MTRAGNWNEVSSRVCATIGAVLLIALLAADSASASLIGIDAGSAGPGTSSLLATLSAPDSFSFDMTGRHSFDFQGDADNETIVINAQPNTDYRILEVIGLALTSHDPSFVEEAIIGIRTPDNPGDTELNIFFTGAGFVGSAGPLNLGPIDLSLSAISLVTGPSGQVVVELYEVNFDDFPNGIDADWDGGRITLSTLDQAAGVPEPSAMALALTGLVALATRRRKRTL